MAFPRTLSGPRPNLRHPEHHPRFPATAPASRSVPGPFGSGSADKVRPLAAFSTAIETNSRTESGLDIAGRRSPAPDQALRARSMSSTQDDPEGSMLAKVASHAAYTSR